jgi:MFS family permease
MLLETMKLMLIRMLKNFRRKKFFSPIFVIALTIFIDISGFGIVLPLLPFYAQSFGANSLQLGMLVGSFSIMQFIFSPLLGALSDSKGRKPILLISIFFSGLSFVLFAFANSLLILLISRLIAGMATESAVARAFVADVTEENERSSAMGKVGAAFGAGFVVGPVLGGLLSNFGFFGPGIGAAILTLVNFVSVLLFLPSKSNLTETGFSYSNYINAFKLGFNRPKIGIVLGINFIVTLAFSAIPVILPLLGISFFAFQEIEMSYFFMYIGLVQIFLQGFLIGRLVKKFGDELLIVFGSLLMAIGTFAVALYANLSLFILSVTLISGGISILNTIIPSFISKRTSSKNQGKGMGLINSVSNIAQIFGPLLGGITFEFAGLFFSFLLSTVFLLVAFGLSCRTFQTCRF